MFMGTQKSCISLYYREISTHIKILLALERMLQAFAKMIEKLFLFFFVRYFVLTSMVWYTYT